jgi:lipopolysaccharide heptosyltransferase I
MTDATTTAAPRLLIVRLSSLGDVLHSLPAAHNLRVATGAVMDWVVQSEYAELVRCFEGVDRVITTSRRAFVRNLPALWRELRAVRYDWVFDLQGLLKSAMVAGMARGPRRIGPSYHREGSRFLYHRVAGAPDRSRHAVEQALDAVRFMGFDVLPPRFPVRFPTATLAGAGGKRVALLPVSRWESKNWPLAHFAALAHMLLEDPGVSLDLLGSAADRAVCEQLASGLPTERVRNLAGTLSLVELGSRLQALDLLIANDSGPVHLAAAVGTRTLVLFGPTDPARTGPYGEGHRVLSAPAPCAPCYRRRCHVHGHACLDSILPDQVAGVARSMLSARKRAGASGNLKR